MTELTASMEHALKRAREDLAFWWELENINSAKRWALTEEAVLQEKEEMRMTAQLQEILAELHTERAALVNCISYYDSVSITPKWVDMFARERARVNLFGSQVWYAQHTVEQRQREVHHALLYLQHRQQQPQQQYG